MLFYRFSKLWIVYVSDSYYWCFRVFRIKLIDFCWYEGVRLCKVGNIWYEYNDWNVFVFCLWNWWWFVWWVVFSNVIGKKSSRVVMLFVKW